MEVIMRAWGHEQGHGRVRVSRMLMPKGYMRLQPSGNVKEESPPRKRSGHVTSGPSVPKQQQQQQQQQRGKWRFRVRPKVRVLYSTIFTLGRRLRDSYAKVMLALAAKAKVTSLLPVVGSSKKKGRSTGVRNGAMLRSGNGSAFGCGFDLTDVESKYLDYVKRSITDGELAYYTMSLRTTGIL